MKSIFGRLVLSLASVLVIAGCATEKQAGVGASFKGPVGLQLYSLRNSFKTDVPGTMAMAHKLGFKYVELAGTYNLSVPEFNKLLAANQLTPVAAHFPYKRWKDEPEAVALEAKALKLKYAGCAWIDHTGDFTEQGCREAIAVFNRAGEVLAKHGMKFFYHTHGYEFQPYKNGTLFDLLLAETKPGLVSYEMDVFWVFHPGQDPAALLDKYGKRFELMHVKDIRKGVKGDLTGHSDVNNDVVPGTGQMNWPAILSAAKRAGVKWYFIEDESDSVLQQLPQTLQFLETVKF